MSDVKCPYCGHEQDIEHDDGYGYEEDTEHSQECEECGKEFDFYTIIHFSYNVYCKDGDHDMRPFEDNFPYMYRCSKCDFYERREPEEEDS